MEDFETRREFWYFVGMCVFGCLAALFGLITFVYVPLCEDVTNQLLEKSEQLEDMTFEANRYKMLYEEMYEMHQYCIESGGEYTCQTKKEN